MKRSLKSQEPQIRGWGNQAEIQNDELVLDNILRRKTTVGTLPRIDLQQRKPAKHLKKYSHSKLPVYGQEGKQSSQAKTATVSPFRPKESVRNSEGPKGTIEPLKQKLRQIMNEQQEQLGRHQSIIRQDCEQNENSRFTPQRRSDSPHEKLSNKELGSKLFRMQTVISKRQNQSIASNFIRYEAESPDKNCQELKKTQSRTYLKLNTLQLEQKQKKLKKNFFEHYPAINPANLRPSQIKEEPHVKALKEKYSKQALQTIDKMQEISRVDKVAKKMRETFVKQDIFSQERKKAEKQSSLKEFNDEVMFTYNNSLNLLQSKSPMLFKPQSKSKERDLKVPMRYRLIIY